MDKDRIKHLPVVVIACSVLQETLVQKLPPEIAQKITFLDAGLHTFPKKLNASIQQVIDAIEETSFVLLGYGLCGNGLDRIASRSHTLAIPRADDCISLFLGSQKRYYEEFSSNPATYYITKGWLESGDTPYHEFERLAAKYGQETAEWLLDQQYHHYQRLVFVAHSQDDLDQYRSQALEVARFCERRGMLYEEILGSDRFVQQIVAAITDPSQLTNEFVLVLPGTTSKQDDFRFEPNQS